MALQAVDDIRVPAPTPFNTTGAGYQTAGTIAASGAKFAVVFRYPKAGTIDEFGIRLQTVTQWPASGLRFSLQDVSGTDGNPDGNADQYHVITASQTAGTLLMSGVLTDDGTGVTGNKRTVTRGEVGSLVADFASFASGDSVAFSAFNTTANSWDSTVFPYQDVHNGTSWSKASTSVVVVLKYSDGTYARVVAGVPPASAFGTYSVGLNTTPDEVGIKFRLPYPFKVGGGWYRATPAGDPSLVIYDSDGTTALVTTTTDSDLRGSTSQSTGFVTFATEMTGAANTWYRYVFKATTTTALTLPYFDVPSAAFMQAAHGGADIHCTERTDAGSWTDTTTRRPFMGLLITALDDGAGGGGSYTDPLEANVKVGVGYTYNSVSKTGTYDGSDRWTDPGVGNVEAGVAYKANSTSNNRTGTFGVPAEAEVEDGVGYGADDTEFTGTLTGGGGASVEDIVDGVEAMLDTLGINATWAGAVPSNVTKWRGNNLRTPAGTAEDPAEISGVPMVDARYFEATASTEGEDITEAGIADATVVALDTWLDAIIAILEDTGTTIPATLAAIAAHIDTEVAAIKAKTDLIPAAPAAVGDIPTPPTTAQIADKLLGRSIAGGADGGRDVRRALRFLSNRFEFDVPVVGQWTLFGEDDVTPVETGTYVRNAAKVGAITSFNPAGGA